MQQPQLRKILCPVDFSALSGVAARYASLLQTCQNGHIYFLFADPISAPPYFTADQVEALKRELEHARRRAAESLQKFLRETLGELPANSEAMIVEQEPVDAIINTATEKQVDVIVMGTHGRSGLNRLLLGSVTEKVLHRASVPVLTTRGELEGFHGEIRKILCPISPAPVSRRSLEWAVFLTQCFGSNLTVLYVRESEHDPEPEKACEWVPAAVKQRCQFQVVHRNGLAAQEILNYAVTQSIDLIVIGAQHRRFFDTTVLGTTTLRVVRHAPCPVLSVIQQAGD